MWVEHCGGGWADHRALHVSEVQISVCACPGRRLEAIGSEICRSCGPHTDCTVEGMIEISSIKDPAAVLSVVAMWGVDVCAEVVKDRDGVWWWITKEDDGKVGVRVYTGPEGQHGC